MVEMNRYNVVNVNKGKKNHVKITQGKSSRRIEFLSPLRSVSGLQWDLSWTDVGASLKSLGRISELCFVCLCEHVHISVAMCGAFLKHIQLTVYYFFLQEATQHTNLPFRGIFL